MKLTEFAEIVERMRSLQKQYFKTRDANVLRESKTAEREVDKALLDIEEEKKGLSLF